MSIQHTSGGPLIRERGRYSIHEGVDRHHCEILVKCKPSEQHVDHSLGLVGEIVESDGRAVVRLINTPVQFFGQAGEDAEHFALELASEVFGEGFNMLVDVEMHAPRLSRRVYQVAEEYGFSDTPEDLEADGADGDRDGDPVGDPGARREGGGQSATRPAASGKPARSSANFGGSGRDEDGRQVELEDVISPGELAGATELPMPRVETTRARKPRKERAKAGAA